MAIEQTLRSVTASVKGFATETLRVPEQMDTLRSAYSSVSDLSLPDNAPPVFRFRRQVASLGAFPVVRYASDAHIWTRCAPRIRKLPAGGCFLSYHEGGSKNTETGKGDHWQQEGETLVTHLEQPWVTRSLGSSMRTIWLSEAHVASLPGIEDMHGSIISGPLSRLLGEHLRFALDQADLLSAQAAAQLARSTHLLLAAVISQHPDALARAAEPLNAALLRRIRDLVDRNLASPTLTPKTIAAHVGISRRKLYMLLEPRGGVARYVQDCRLDRARYSLADAGTISIKDTSFRHGFKSQSHFSRAFRQRFGDLPSDVFGKAR